MCDEGRATVRRTPSGSIDVTHVRELRLRHDAALARVDSAALRRLVYALPPPLSGVVREAASPRRDEPCAVLLGEQVRAQAVEVPEAVLEVVPPLRGGVVLAQAAK